MSLLIDCCHSLRGFSSVQRRDIAKSKLASLEFDYSDPSRDFDRSQVKGLVATLIAIAPSNHAAATALEICAGGKLWGVVVETAEVGSALLQKGNLRKRVTLIPLDKIDDTTASDQVMQRVFKVSENKAALALSLIGYDEEVEKAMAWVFGKTLICPSPDVAKKVTFDNAIRMKSVTLEGDVYDPSGTLSGGSKSKTGGIIIRVQELNEINAELKECRGVLEGIEKEWEAAKSEMDAFKSAKKSLELKSHEVGLLEERVQESNATRVSLSSILS